MNHHIRSCNKSQRRHQDLVAATDIKRLQAELKRGRRGVNRNRVIRAMHAGEHFLEASNPVAHGEPTVVDHGAQGLLFGLAKARCTELD
jgi:hypothetical protein